MTELDRIKDEVAKEHGCSINWYIFKGVPGFAIDEIAKRYATACVKASLERAAESAYVEPDFNSGEVNKYSITSESNIVLL